MPTNHELAARRRSAMVQALWNAVALNVVLLLAILAAGMIFAVERLAEVLTVVGGCSLVFWGYLSLVFLAISRICRLLGLNRDPSDDRLHDDWLDGTDEAPPKTPSLEEWDLD